MAPNFLSKLVKVATPNNRDRSSSETSPRNSGFSLPRGRSQSTSKAQQSAQVASPTTPTPASTLNSRNNNNIPSIITTLSATKGDRRSFESIDTASTQPNVTIVPPSPLVRNGELSDDSEDEDAIHPTSSGPVTGTDSNNNSRTTTPSSPDDDGATPTPTPTIPKKQNPLVSPPASASTTNVNGEPIKSSNSATTTPMASTLAPGAYQVRKQPSNKSINNSKKPTEINVNHTKAATAPAEVSDTTGAVTMKPIVESPTDVKFPDNAAAERPNGGSTANLGIKRENTDAGSINGDKKPAQRSWRRSTTRKPTGLASAIAASGLAMANPSLSPSHQAQITSPPIVSPQQSGSGSASSRKGGAPPPLPYMSRSPAQSSTSQHNKTRSADLSPRSSKSRRSSNGTSNGDRKRRPSVSANSDAGTDNYGGNGDEVRPEYYSGLDEGSSDDDGSGSDVDSDDLEMGDDDIPVTGFAVASNKRNADFHELFPTVPEGDYLIEDYGCALQREILIQGRIYISENHICFHANIFGWITDLSIPIYEITSLEKKMTAFVIPNAIQITTRQAKYTFASFLSRDTTFDVIYNIWRLARPEDNGSVQSRGRGSMENPDASASAVAVAGAAVPGAGAAPAGGGKVRKATQCACGRDGKHFTETAMDTTIPGTPDRIHNLMFASGFIKDFMAVNQKLLDIQMSDWSPVSPGSNLLTRNMSYIKPLNGSLGPKQTKCEISDETVHTDFDDYISTVTTTRTPDVPSGGVFAVKTRTCVMWAGPVSTRVLVTTQVDWSGRSFIKGIIERSAIEGQKVYHNDLEKAMRAYIQEHKSEFLPEGIVPADHEEVAEAPAAAGAVPDTPGRADERNMTEEERKQRERERNARGLQWAWDTFDGAAQVAIRSTKGALELIWDAWDQSSATTILWFVIVGLVISNLWTLMRVGRGKEEVRRKVEERRVEEREKWVQSVVTALWDELAAGKREAAVLVNGVLQAGGHAGGAGHGIPVASSAVVEAPKGWKEEVNHLHHTLDAVEERVKGIRKSLAGFQENLDAMD
ncbi:hypothetical protein B0H34DRAFT_645545 [Crassisporium funariophilum]|nr:hypothetical protein B0H34DRAFT_645545 [Crassisporium funariophilum]